jgi:hypothetical protein
MANFKKHLTDYQKAVLTVAIKLAIANRRRNGLTIEGPDIYFDVVDSVKDLNGKIPAETCMFLVRQVKAEMKGF